MANDLNLVALHETEFGDVFMLTKATLFPYINDTFGWHDDFQYQRLKNDYPLSWYYWVKYQNKRVGLLCFKPQTKSYHIHLLIVFPEFHRQGLGSKIMAQVYDIAERNQCDSITLSSFKSNKKAIEFYRKLGYKITNDSDKDFVTMKLDVVSKLGGISTKLNLI